MEHIVVSREAFDQLAKAIKKHDMKEITFEFIVGSCFPNIMKNIKKEMRRQYTLGYAEGLKRGELNDDELGIN